MNNFGAAEAILASAHAEKRGALYDPYCDYAPGLGVPVFRSADRAAEIYRKYLEYSLKA